MSSELPNNAPPVPKDCVYVGLGPLLTRKELADLYDEITAHAGTIDILWLRDYDMGIKGAWGLNGVGVLASSSSTYYCVRLHSPIHEFLKESGKLPSEQPITAYEF